MNFHVSIQHSWGHNSSDSIVTRLQAGGLRNLGLIPGRSKVFLLRST